MRPRHLLEFIGVRTLFLLFELLPLRAASALGGWLGETFGPLFPVTNIARANLRMILPERAKEHKTIIRGMWNNFGRVFAEYPHLRTIAESRGGARVELRGIEHLQELREMGRGGLIIVGHFANWEFGTDVAAARGMPMHVVYRAPNNPLVDRLLSSARSKAVSSIPKGAAGAKEILRVLKSKEFIAMLIDQKMNDGVSLPFMGHEAMTVIAPAQLAIKYQVPLCLAQCERIKSVHFRWTLMKPFIPPPDSDAAQVMAQLNEKLGEWVRARPEQWLWVHRRWGK